MQFGLLPLQNPLRVAEEWAVADTYLKAGPASPLPLVELPG